MGSAGIEGGDPFVTSVSLEARLTRCWWVKGECHGRVVRKGHTSVGKGADVASRTTTAGEGQLVETDAMARAVSLLISRCVGACRCVGSGLCGLHRLEPAADTAQGSATWTVETAAAALVEAGTAVSRPVRRRWAADLVATVLAGEAAPAFRLGARGAL